MASLYTKTEKVLRPVTEHVECENRRFFWRIFSMVQSESKVDSSKFQKFYKNLTLSVVSADSVFFL